AFTYPSGALLVAAMAAWALWRRKVLVLASAALTLSGFALVLALFQLTVGDWQAFFKVQRKYGFGLVWPHATLAERLLPLLGDGTLFPALQTLLVALLMVALIVALALRWRPPVAAAALVALQAALFRLFPLAVGAGP